MKISISKISKHYVFSGLGLCLMTFLYRFPFFSEIGIPFFGADTYEYYGIVEMLLNQKAKQIGYPSLGYPMFLYLMWIFGASNLGILLFQHVLQLIACLFFLYSAHRHFPNYTTVFAIALTAYMVAPMGLYYDSSLLPDSLLSSCFILGAGCLMWITYSDKWVPMLGFALMATLALSLRPNGILLHVSGMLVLIYKVIRAPTNRSWIVGITALIVGGLILSTISFFSPLYGAFKPWMRPVNPIPYDVGADTAYVGDGLWKKLSIIDSEGTFYNKPYDFGLFQNQSAYTYIHSYQRGFRLRLDTMQQVWLDNFTNNGAKNRTISLSDLADANGHFLDAQKGYSYVKDRLELTGKPIRIYPQENWYERLLLFVSMFKFFYVQDIVNDHGRENADFYKETARTFFDHQRRVFLYHPLGPIERDGFSSLDRLVFKESLLRPEILEDEEAVNTIKTQSQWDILSSRHYRWFIRPVSWIHHHIFLQPILPIWLLLTWCWSSVRLLLDKGERNAEILIFALGGLLVAHAILHGFYLVFLLSRYSYQVSFIYYLFIPLGLLFWRLKKRQLNDESSHKDRLFHMGIKNLFSVVAYK